MSANSRRVEVLRSTSYQSGGETGQWVRVKFSQLKAGDIFRIFDINEQGFEVPDMVVKGQHEVCVAVGDAQPCCKGKCPGKYVVKYLPARGFKGSVYKGWKPAWRRSNKEKSNGSRKQGNPNVRP